MSRPIRVRVVPGSAEWRELRRSGVGASDIPVITGDSRFGDVVTLYQEKLGYTADPVETDFMASGNWLEDLIARWYAEREGRKVRRPNALLRSRERPWMIATPDRAVAGYGLLEVKVTDHPGDRWGTPGTDQVPDDVREQTTWQAAVADVEVVDVAVFFTRTRRREVYTVGRDPALVDELIEYGAGFWHSVETRTPPEPTGRAVRALLRADEVEADEQLTAYVARYLAARDDLEAMEAEAEEAKRLIRDRLDEVGGARGDGFRIHYRPHEVRRTAWEKVAREYDRIIDLFNEARAGNPEVTPEMLDDAIKRWGQIETDLTRVDHSRPLLIKQPKESRTHAA